MSRQTLILALAGLLLCAQGCNRPMVIRADDGQSIPAPSGEALVAQPDSPVPDVPMPDGFVAITDKCRSSVTNGARFVDHYYMGRARYDWIINFYRQQLISHGWDKLSADQVSTNAIVMHYFKGRENLELQIIKPERVATVHLLIQRSTGSLGPRPVAP